MNSDKIAPTADQRHQQSVFAELIISPLQAKFLGGLVSFQTKSWQCVLLTTGSLDRITPETQETISAPALVWLPVEADTRLRASAGSTGILIVLDATTLSNSIGHKPEAASLRLMSSRRLTINLTNMQDMLQIVHSSLNAILRELEQASAGMDTIIEAHLRIVLVSIWRNLSQGHFDENASTGSALLLESFRQSLETHMRERWPVSRYAQELGVSSDHLHDICTRVLNKAPKKLIQERLAFEAETLLAKSQMTLGQIADYLGFPSAPQFFAFFKTQTGMPPGRYRKQMRGRAQRQNSESDRTFADWP
ncbi:helix-turn-helix domain-containing protein [Pseudahrensia aquimaris]|uniref:Helix-turn-helix domain-containing protein n=1 Tax=Pseudahrensia aquimaris TaxID=744461 RepID=A0ABW3FJN0_9HYPH